MKVLIVGAGVAGLGIGWRLRQSGAEVTILERGQAARGATWASAGMIAVAGEMSAAPTAEMEFAWHASRLWPDFAAEVESTSGLEIGYRRDGALMVALDAAPLEAAPGVARLTSAEARAKEPMLAGDIQRALWAPDDAQVDSRTLGQALARAFVRAGGTLSLNEPVVRFEVVEGAVTSVHSPVGRHEADSYVLAAGAWSGAFGGLPDEALPPVKPIKGEIIAIAPPAGASLPRHVVWGNEVYLVPRRDRLLIGATEADIGFDTSVTGAAADWLSSHAIRLMPALAQWSVVERWAGLRPGSPDGLPMLGPSALDRLFIATGQYRNGILFAPALAENMSRLVMGHAEGISAFDPRRFHKGQGHA
ncbi:MAG TPA: glycine oxidase ThiO [Rhizomicrobium sp.]|nr:glycine oxidase ThiO [Rhizomicrobium sp.]